MNILAIGAHPDDVELCCGGTLAKYAKQGHKVFTATTTNGNIGSATLPMEEIARIRKEEARRAAAIIGAEYICLDYDDEMLFEDKQARIAIIDLIRYCKADVIITHNPTDYNPDHELTSKLVRDVAVMIPIRKIETRSPACDTIPALVYMEPSKGIGFIPTEYVDITAEMETKMEMLAQHESQVSWMAANYGDVKGNFMDQYRIMSAYRGFQCGVDYAEGFRMAMDAHRIYPYRILP